MERFTGLLGIAVILAVSYLISNNRKAIGWRLIITGLTLSFGTALLMYRMPGSEDILNGISDLLKRVYGYAQDGERFVLGGLPPHVIDMLLKSFLFAVFGSITFMSGLMAIGYHTRIMEFLVRGFAYVFRWMNVSGREALSTASEIFFGQVEAQLVIVRYISKLTLSEVFSVMTVGMTTVSGSILLTYIGFGINPADVLTATLITAPVGLLIAKMQFPETDLSVIHEKVEMEISKEAQNWFHAFWLGVQRGAAVAGCVILAIGSTYGLVKLIDGESAHFFAWCGYNFTIEDIGGYVLRPCAWLIGIPWEDTFHAGKLMTTKLLLTELPAYEELATVIHGKAAYTLSPKTIQIMTITLCSFANVGSVAINVAGLGSMAPERLSDFAKLGFRALLAATMASWLAAAIVGIVA